MPIYPTLEINKKAPSFSLQGIDEKKHSLSDYKRYKILVIVFTANHCPTAQAYEKRIKKFVKDYEKKKVALIAISPNHPEALADTELRFSALGDSFEDMKIHAKQQNFNFSYLYDGDDQLVSQKYGPKATPHFFVFDKRRKLQYQGGFDNNPKGNNIKKHYVRDAVNSLLAGKKPLIQKAKTLGCSTKWKYKTQTALKVKQKILNTPVSVEKINLTGIKELLNNKGSNLRLINFWATWCTPCVAEYPILSTLLRTYVKRDFELITISLDQLKHKDKVQKFLQSHGMSLQGNAKKQALESGRSTHNFIFADGYQEKLIKSISPSWSGALPYTMLITPKNEILFAQENIISLNQVKKIIFDYYGPRGY